MSDCIFCQIVAGEAPATFVSEGPDHVAFAPHRPHTPGHVMFVPKEHVSDAADSPTMTGIVMTRAALYVKNVVQGPANIITSIGAESTQTVFHLHVHVVPRGRNDGIRKNWPWRIRLSDGLRPGDIFPEEGYTEGIEQLLGKWPVPALESAKN